MDSVSEHRAYSPESLRFAVVTASDSRKESEDRSGSLITAMATRAGHRVVFRRVARDVVDEIRQSVEVALAEHAADVVVVNGGTGFSARDVTLDALLPLFDRPVEGFGELFRWLSYEQVGAAAMLSRACAGTVGSAVVFLAPGSPKAVELAMTALILPESAHLIGQLRR